MKTGTVASKNKTVQAFSLTTDASMAPKARILVYYVRQDGEIVADSSILSVDGAFLNKVLNDVKVRLLCFYTYQKKSSKLNDIDELNVSKHLHKW